ncbi:MAG TPA: sortase [Candidatus Saccharimonadales bacterium]|nr:sortase [Candidatus Saccharimonadales bacterium]
MLNPLLSNNQDDKKKKDDQGYVLGKRHTGRIEPIHKNIRLGSDKPKPIPAPQPTPMPTAVVSAPVEPLHPQAEAKKSDNPAVELIRHKLDALYAKEPSAKEEIKEPNQPEAPVHRSKHQQVMYNLSTSGKSLAEIQTAWHQYYVDLPDAEKHEVWQEFYAESSRRPSPYAQFVEKRAEQTPAVSEAKPETTGDDNTVAKVGTFEAMPPVLPHREKRTRAAIKRQLLDRVSAEAQEKAKRHLKSLLFGISTGVIVLAIFLFSFFNEVIIAPFIQPSRKADATPIILNTDGVSPTDQNLVIIPKINVQIPLDFSVNTTDETAIENSLENGVVHYPTTAQPGQKGNTAFFGHSSNNIFNSGKYKFAFVLLHDLVPGDIFYITYNGKVYSYRVYQKQIVDPSNVSVLNNVADKAATATLITCDPPGTSLRRLVVWGEQVSPDPSGNAAATTPTATNTPVALPSNGPTLWGRFIHWLFH